jgi:DNA primase large subunit
MTTLIALVESVLIVLSTVVLVLRRLFGKRRKKRSKVRPLPPQWRVKVVPVSEGYVHVKSVMEVRIMRKGRKYQSEDEQSIGKIPTTASDFDKQMADLIDMAEQCAASLNAISDEYA